MDFRFILYSLPFWFTVRFARVLLPTAYAFGSTTWTTLGLGLRTAPPRCAAADYCTALPLPYRAYWVVLPVLSVSATRTRITGLFRRILHGHNWFRFVWICAFRYCLTLHTPNVLIGRSPFGHVSGLPAGAGGHLHPNRCAGDASFRFA